MTKELILLPSVTYAMKAKSILDKHSIRAYIQRTPRGTAINSCGYCIFVPGRTDEAENVLRKSGIRVLGRSAREDV